MAETLQDRPTKVEAQIGALEDVSIEVRARVAAQILQGQGSVEDVVGQLTEELGKNVAFRVAEEPFSDEEADDVKEPVLDPEVKTALLEKLKGRFEANMNRHEGIQWADVQRSLEADPEKLCSLQKMEEAGHEPDVYKEDDGAYHFGTCSIESPESARNIVFDAAAEAWLREKHPQVQFHRNAVDIAAAMGIDLMSEEQYRHLQTLEQFDDNSLSWLKTLDEMRKRGYALYGNRYGEHVYVRRSVADFHDHTGAFRASLRVSKA